MVKYAAKNKYEVVFRELLAWRTDSSYRKQVHHAAGHLTLD